VLGEGGRNLSLKEAEAIIFCYSFGLVFARRDRQAEDKDKGRAWEIAKNYDDAGVMGVVTPKSETGLMENASITLDVNGQERQAGDINQMAYNTVELIAFLSTLQELKAGDLVFTGTPSGVGAVSRGDRLEGRIDGLQLLSVAMV